MISYDLKSTLMQLESRYHAVLGDNKYTFLDDDIIVIYMLHYFGIILYKLMLNNKSGLIDEAFSDSLGV